MTLNEDSARRIAEQFQRGNPEDRYKKSRPVSHRELVGSLYEAIMAKRKDGYSFEGIVAQLEQLGAAMSVSTLKSYLLEAGRKARPATAGVSRKNRQTKRGSTQTPTHGRKPARQNAEATADSPSNEVRSAAQKPPENAVAERPIGAEVDRDNLEPTGATNAQTARAGAAAVAQIDAAANKLPKEERLAQPAPTNGSAKASGSTERLHVQPTAHAPATNSGSFGFVPRNR